MRSIFFLIIILGIQCYSCCTFSTRSKEKSALKYNIYQKEVMCMLKSTDTSWISAFPCSSIDDTLLYGNDMVKIKIPSYLSLSLEIMPYGNSTTESKLRYSFGNNCIILSSDIVVHKQDGIIGFRGGKYQWNCSNNNTVATAFADTLRKYKQVLNPWLRAEAERRGVFK